MSPLIAFALGLAALVAGGELLVRGSVAAARRLQVSPLLVGLVLVGFGTSAPELAASLSAAFAGAPGIAVGNVVGSNVANVLLILGATALVGPIAIDLASVRRDAGVMIAASFAAAVALLLYGGVDRLVGGAFLLALAAYLVWAYRAERAAATPGGEIHAREGEAEAAPDLRLLPALGLAAAGIALVVVGAGWLVDGAVWIARWAGLSEAVIGLTIVAVGTSLPELVAGIAAALRGQPGLAFGNVLGSNVYNVLLILGATGAAQPFATPAGVSVLEVGIMLAAALVVLPIALTGGRICRREGALLLAGYAAYGGVVLT